jgi:hypothetical protein
MLKIWILIVSGIILVPLIATITKELEERLSKIRDNKYQNDQGDKLNKKDDIEFTVKFLKYAAIALFVVITIIMIRFTTQIISSK